MRGFASRKEKRSSRAYAVCVFLNLQAISEELPAQEERLRRIRSAAAELGKSLAMSPVASEPCVGLATSAERVARQLQLLEQSVGLMAEALDRQSSAESSCNGAVLSAEKIIDHARQVTGFPSSSVPIPGLIPSGSFVTLSINASIRSHASFPAINGRLKRDSDRTICWC